MDALITRRAGGAAPLNLFVVGGTTKPASPKENTIWINTNQEITGWVFQASKPSAPAQGVVWIEMDNDSNVSTNVISKNALYVYPGTAAQYVNEAWVDKSAQTYYANAWHENVHIVFDGGWNNEGIYYTQHTTATGDSSSGNGGATANSTRIAMYFNRYDGYYIPGIDVTKYKTLELEYSFDHINWLYWGLSTNATWYDNNATSYVVYSSASNTSRGRTTATYDISKLTGKYNFKVCCWPYGGNYFYIYKLRLK